MPTTTPKRAIVLSGGGARGAYEAGVLRFILDELPRRTGVTPDFDIVSGTSVGAGSRRRRDGVASTPGR